jgi:hypothetical protein
MVAVALVARQELLWLEINLFCHSTLLDAFVYLYQYGTPVPYAPVHHTVVCIHTLCLKVELNHLRRVENRLRERQP